MCLKMSQNQEGNQEKHLTKQLAAIVENIQWSYAIFWAASVTQQGVLAWGDGYYNGDIKTRKTTQPTEFKADQIGLQRSEQLRELYFSLSVDETNQQTRRASVSLSPEDLTAAEWYYLVCMSFTFGPGQGLPGKALASNQNLWLSNAQSADSGTFSRSLLAKSASIQTVVCFPFMGGVLELGTTDLVLEDARLIKQVTATFRELPVPVGSEQSISSSPAAEKDEDVVHQILDHGLEDVMALENHNLIPEHQTLLEDILSPLAFNFPSYPHNGDAELIHDQELNPSISEELQIGSPDGSSSNDYYLNHHTDDSFMIEGLNVSSQVQSCQLMDGENSNWPHDSLNSSDCISFVNHPRILSSPRGERIKDPVLDYLQEGNNGLVSLDPDGQETHYKRTISAILTNSKESASGSCFSGGSSVSSFRSWRRNLTSPNPLGGTSQKLLKKILTGASWIQGGRSMKPQEESGTRDKVWKPEGDDVGVSHVLSERRRREKLNEKFVVLRSLIPSISKVNRRTVHRRGIKENAEITVVDKASILGDTIEYLNELERRVEELESCKEIVEHEAREKRKHTDIAERTSDNCGNNDRLKRRKSSVNKRKACDIEEEEAYHDHRSMSKENMVDINVTLLESEVILEMSCPWRDRMLLEIIDAISNLQLDAHSVQSSNINGILTLSLKAKRRDSAVVSPGMVKRALQRVISK